MRPAQAPLLLLLVGVPPQPSSLRVRVWRRLRSLGAVALKRTVYLLPDTPDHYEHFQWLSQEIQREGGEAKAAARRADREHERCRRGSHVPRSLRPGLPRAGWPLSQDVARAGSEVCGEERAHQESLAQR